jgi:hypothetical protein
MATKSTKSHKNKRGRGWGDRRDGEMEKKYV